MAVWKMRMVEFRMYGSSDATMGTRRLSSSFGLLRRESPRKISLDSDAMIHGDAKQQCTLGVAGRIDILWKYQIVVRSDVEIGGVGDAVL